jgi:Cof subfamily protein (haloacid dehalogenase superfamily)
MPKYLKDFKALLFDVDLTLTNTGRIISPRTQAAIRQLGQYGVALNVCSGRHAATLKKTVFSFFPDTSIHVTCGGSQIVQNDGTVLWEKFLSEKVCELICITADKQGLGISLPIGEWVYANETMFERYKLKPHLKDFLKPLDQKPHWYANVIVVTEITDEFVKFLDTIPEISYKKGPSSTGSVYVDICSKGLNKAVGIMEWSKITGIEPSEIIGFGDAENDFEFLQFVGYSVAMGNADERLKKLANRVIGHTDQDGLAIYLEQLMEGAPV